MVRDVRVCNLVVDVTSTMSPQDDPGDSILPYSGYRDGEGMGKAWMPCGRHSRGLHHTNITAMFLRMTCRKC